MGAFGGDLRSCRRLWSFDFGIFAERVWALLVVIFAAAEGFGASTSEFSLSVYGRLVVIFAAAEGFGASFRIYADASVDAFGQRTKALGLRFGFCVCRAHVNVRFGAA